MIWQANREGRPVWFQTVGLALLGPLLNLIAGYAFDGSVLMVLFYLAVLIQGTSVFGLENAAGTRQFLDNQAVPPGTVWAAKVVSWGFGLVGMVLLSVAATMLVGPVSSSRFDLFILPIITLDAFTVGLLGGMIFRRRITAALISGLGLILVAAPQISLVQSQMAPEWMLLVSPLLLLATSRVWAGDWLAARGIRRWLRLAGLLVGGFGGLFLAYIGGRAWGVPDLGPQYLERSTDSSTELNQAYREIASRVAVAPDEPVINRVRSGPDTQATPFDRGNDWAKVPPGSINLWKVNLPAIEQARTTSALPGSIEDTSAASPISPAIRNNSEEWGQIERLSDLLKLDAIERRSRDDLTGAWEDILAQFRISRQYASGARSITTYDLAMKISQGALDQVLFWARDPRVSVQAIHAARASLRQLTVPKISDAIRAQSNVIERLLDQSTDWWMQYLASQRNNRDDQLNFEQVLNGWAMAPWWERERTRRITRQVTAIAIEIADFDRPTVHLRGPNQTIIRKTQSVDRLRNIQGFDPVGFEPFFPQLGTEYLVTPLADRVLEPLMLPASSYIREVTNRRALDTFLAVRAWQLIHEGRAPDSLVDLLPSELDELPLDPYVPSRTLEYQDASLSPIPVDPSGATNPPFEPSTAPRRASQFVISSVGPDRVSTGIESGIENLGDFPTMRKGSDDLLYVLPPDPLPHASKP